MTLSTNSKEPFALPDRYSDAFRNLVEKQLLNKSAVSRPTMNQVLTSAVMLEAIAELVADNDWGFRS